MEKVILIVHGSPVEKANQLDDLAGRLTEVLKIKRDDLVISFLKYGKPSPYEAIENFINEGAKRIIIHPFFLTTGGHTSKDIPTIIEELKKSHPQVEFLCTKPLGTSEKLAFVIKELIDEVRGQPR